MAELFCLYPTTISPGSFSSTKKVLLDFESSSLIRLAGVCVEREKRDFGTTMATSFISVAVVVVAECCLEVFFFLWCQSDSDWNRETNQLVSGCLSGIAPILPYSSLWYFVFFFQCVILFSLTSLLFYFHFSFPLWKIFFFFCYLILFLVVFFSIFQIIINHLFNFYHKTENYGSRELCEDQMQPNDGEREKQIVCRAGGSHHSPPGGTLLIATTHRRRRSHRGRRHHAGGFPTPPPSAYPIRPSLLLFGATYQPLFLFSFNNNFDSDYFSYSNIFFIYFIILYIGGGVREGPWGGFIIEQLIFQVGGVQAGFLLFIFL